MTADQKRAKTAALDAAPPDAGRIATLRGRCLDRKASLKEFADSDQRILADADALAPRTPKEMLQLAEAWRPWRGVAARILWAYYAANKRRDAVPVQPSQ